MNINSNSMIQTFLWNLRRTMSNMNYYNSRISAGRKLLFASDNPSGAALLLKLSASIKANTQYIDNIKQGSAWIDYSNSALKDSGELVLRMKELALDSANDHHSAASRKDLADEVNQSIENLLKLANTNYAGRYIFSGRKTDQKAFENKDAKIEPLDNIPSLVKRVYNSNVFNDTTELKSGIYNINISSNGKDILLNIQDEQGNYVMLDDDGMNDTVNGNKMSSFIVIENAKNKVYNSGRGLSFEFGDEIFSTNGNKSFRIQYTPGNHWQYLGDDGYFSEEISVGDKVDINVPGNKVFGGTKKLGSLSNPNITKNGKPITRGTTWDYVNNANVNIGDSIKIGGYDHNGNEMTPYAYVKSDTVTLDQSKTNSVQRTLKFILNGQGTSDAAEFVNKEEAFNLGLLEITGGSTNTTVGSYTTSILSIQKYFVNNEHSSNYDIGTNDENATLSSTIFGAVKPSAGEVITWKGKDINGNIVNGSFSFSSNPNNDTINDLFTAIENSFGGNIDLQIKNGKITAKSNIAGSTGNFEISGFEYLGSGNFISNALNLKNKIKGTDWRGKLGSGDYTYFNKNESVLFDNKQKDKVSIQFGDRILEGSTSIRFTGSYNITIDARQYENLNDLRDEINNKILDSSLNGLVFAVVEDNRLKFVTTNNGKNVSLSILGSEDGNLGFTTKSGTRSGSDNYIVKRDHKISDLLDTIEGNFGNMITTDVDSDGKIIFQDLRDGKSNLSIELGEGIGEISRWGNTSTFVEKNAYGTYTGMEADRWNFIVNKDGEIGSTEGLKINVYNQAGRLVNSLNVGQNYIPGKKLYVGDGIYVKFSSGKVVANSKFSIELDPVKVDFGQSQTIQEGDEVNIFKTLKNLKDALDLNIVERKAEVLDNWKSGSTTTPVLAGDFKADYNDLWTFNVDSVNGTFGRLESGIIDLNMANSTEAQRSFVVKIGDDISQSITVDAKNYVNINELIDNLNQKFLSNEILAGKIKAERSTNNQITLIADKIKVKGYANSKIGFGTIEKMSGSAIISVTNKDGQLITNLTVDSSNKYYNIIDGISIAFYRGDFKLNDKFTVKVGAGITSSFDLLDKAKSQIVKQENISGIIGNRLDVTKARLDDLNVINHQNIANTEGSNIEDIAELMTKYANEESAYRNSLAVGARIIQPTLLDFLR